jgi:hypothetical protein
MAVLVLLTQKAWRTANSPVATGARGDNLEVDGYVFTYLAATCTDGEDRRLQAPTPTEGVEGSEATSGKGAAALMSAWRRGNSRRCTRTWSRRQLRNGSGRLGDNASVEVWTKHLERRFRPDTSRRTTTRLAP